MLFIASILFGPKKGALAGAIGMGLFDLVGGWLLWAPITIVARGLQGYIVGKIAWSNGRKGSSLAFKYNRNNCFHSIYDRCLLHLGRDFIW